MADASVRHRLRTVASAILVICTVVVLSSCQSPASRGEWAGAPVEGVDPYSLTRHVGRSGAGCRYDFRQFTPHSGMRGSSETFIIGHGFLRHQRTMSGLAAALARRGYPAVTLSFCNMHWWNGNHRQNAADMQTLATELGIARPVYAGFSAGALAALLAAENDPRAVGLITLDLVDQADMGIQAADTLEVPWLALHGEASSCNANNNAAPVYAIAAQLSRLHIHKASHCEFESPTNWLCEQLCGDPDSARKDNAQRQAIIGQVIDQATQFSAVNRKTTDNLFHTLYRTQSQVAAP